MRRSRKTLVLVIAAILLVGQATDVLMQREHFPFSPYPMYAHETHGTTSLLRLYGTVRDGTRTWNMPIVDSNATTFIPEMNELRMKNVLAFSYGSGKPRNIAATRRVLRDYMAIYNRRREATHGQTDIQARSPTGTPPGTVAHIQPPKMLAAECDRLTWSIAGPGMPDPKPRVQQLVTTATPR